MRAVTTAVLVLSVGLFVPACAPLFEGCSREEAPELSATEEQITRNDVVAVLGEPIETIKSEDGRRIDFYEYDGHCSGIIWVIYPLPIFFVTDQMLTVEYGPDGSFLTAEVWPDAETPEVFIASYKRRVKLEEECSRPFSEAKQLDAQTQYDLGANCPSMRSDLQTDLLGWQWMCLSAHQGDHDAQYVLGNYYRRGSNLVLRDLVEAYKWLSLAAKDGDAVTRGYRDVFARQLTSDQIAEAQRLVAAWEPNPAECETIAEQAEN